MKQKRNGLIRHVSTGEFAKMAGINKKTLIFYDEIGLFHPAFINEKGYRFYSVFQMDRLALILTLRDMGVALKEIKSYLEDGDIEKLNDLLAHKEQEIDRIIKDLGRRKQLLLNIKKENEEYLKYSGKGCLILPQEEEHYELLIDDVRKVGTIIVNYITDGPNTGLLIQGDRLMLYRRHGEAPLQMEAGRYLCIYGRYQNYRQDVEPVVEQMKQYAQMQGWQLDQRFFMEVSDLLAEEEKGQAYSLKVRILE